MGDVGWFKNAVIYHILIDRFAGFISSENWNKPDFLGGNINGITKKIPYLKDLGVDCIWISPFYKASAYHGYHVTDFFKVESHFGTINDLKRLIKTVHKNDIRIIADFVPNHCSNKHSFFVEAQQDKNSEYYKWFYFKNWPDDYLCFLSIEELPKINLSYAPARNYIINAAKHWLSLGFDGYRLDHVIGPSHGFWKEFRKEIKKEYPDAVLIGEAWMMGVKFHELKTIHIRWKFLKWLFGSSPDYLLKEYVGELDGVLDFKLQELLKKYIAWNNSGQLKRKITQHYNKYPDDYLLPTFLDNHDTNRFLFECKNNKEKPKTAAEIQFSTGQPAIIYYGTETGVTQGKSQWEIPYHGDLQARRPMNWKNQDKELLFFYKNLIKNRRKK